MEINITFRETNDIVICLDQLIKCQKLLSQIIPIEVKAYEGFYLDRHFLVLENEKGGRQIISVGPIEECYEKGGEIESEFRTGNIRLANIFIQIEAALSKGFNKLVKLDLPKVHIII